MMNIRRYFHITCRAALATAVIACVRPVEAEAGGKVGIYLIHMVPDGVDATSYSRPGWGGGLHVVLPVPQLSNIFAGVGGLEIINLLSETTQFRDNLTGLRVEQQTD